MIRVIMATVRMSMMRMAKSSDADQIDDQPKGADRKQFSEPLHFTTFR